jgi:hypothetical protein
MALHPPAAVLLRAAVGERQRSVADTTDVERRRLVNGAPLARDSPDGGRGRASLNSLPE